MNFRIISVNKLTITMVAPVGVSSRYEAISPTMKLMTERVAPAIVTFLKFLNMVWAESVGKMMRLEMSKAPTRRIPKTIRTEQRIAKIILRILVLMPMACANFSSKVRAKILLWKMM